MAQVHIEVIREARDFVAFVEHAARERLAHARSGQNETTTAARRSSTPRKRG